MTDALTRLRDAIFKNQPEAVLKILAEGVDVDQRFADGSTPLDLAAYRPPEITEHLLVHGAKPDFREKHQGRTPLMTALRNGSFEVAEVLLKAGADPAARTTDGVP